MLNDIAVVTIGRNEGERLRACLSSVVSQACVVVYVDSGSTDDSLAIARELGAEIVELDMSQPFSAARARNAGFRHALELAPQTQAIQFVDGDCEVRLDWMNTARQFLLTHPNAAAVSGRRRERFPERSIYNEICDVEWSVPAGEVKSCGGDVMIRSEGLCQVNGYLERLIAGEEPEMCVRLRQAGWTIHVLDAEMTLHDAAIFRFGQWWLRMKRGGWAYAAGNHLHGRTPERLWIRHSIKAWRWGVLPFAVMFTLLPLFGFFAFGVLMVYPAQFVRLYLRSPGGHRRKLAAAFAYTVGPMAEVQGQIKYWSNAWFGRSDNIIEYK